MNRQNLSSLLYRLRDFFLRHPLGFMIIMVAVVYGVYIFSHISADPSVFDIYIAAFIAFVCGCISITIAVRTPRKRWTTLSAGLFGTFLGLCSAYTLIVYARFEGMFPYFQDSLSMARSIIIVSLLWVLMGLILEWWYMKERNLRGFLSVLRHPISYFRNRKHKDTETSQGE